MELSRNAEKRAEILLADVCRRAAGRFSGLGGNQAAGPGGFGGFLRSDLCPRGAEPEPSAGGDLRRHGPAEFLHHYAFRPPDPVSLPGDAGTEPEEHALFLSDLRKEGHPGSPDPGEPRHRNVGWRATPVGHAAKDAGSGAERPVLSAFRRGDFPCQPAAYAIYDPRAAGQLVLPPGVQSL